MLKNNHSHAAVLKSVSPSEGQPSDAGNAIRDPADLLVLNTLDDHFAGGEHLRFGADGRFWIYTGKFWQPVQETWIEGRILASHERAPIRTNLCTSSLIGQARILLKAKFADKSDSLSFIGEPAPVINCANGEVWLAAVGRPKLRPHRPESGLRHCLDIVYDPKAKCPEYDRAVRDIFASGDNPGALVRHWDELVGYLIQPRRNIATIVILLGKGDNGKTKLLETVVRLLGPELVHCQSVEALGASRFAMGSLFGKLLVADDDVGADAKLPDGRLKIISEAKVVTGERKNGPFFNFVVRAVPVLLCNNIPSLNDLSPGMKRRLMVVPFDRTFTDDKDEDLFNRIWASELPGVLNRALRGYGRVRKRGSRFKPPSAVSAATDDLLQRANPMVAFVHDRCMRGAGAACPLRELYVAYRTWCQHGGFFRRQNQLDFRSNLEHMDFKVYLANTGPLVLGLTLKN
jgi:putative DNA primase/helicase